MPREPVRTSVTSRPRACAERWRLCACGPAALVDGEPVGRLDLDALAGVLTERAA
jgi:hypothetical protein